MWGYGGAPRVSSSHSSTPNDHCGTGKVRRLKPYSKFGGGVAPRSSTSQITLAGNGGSTLPPEHFLSTSQASSLSLLPPPEPSELALSGAWRACEEPMNS